MSNIIIRDGTIHEMLLESSNQGGLNQDMHHALANKNIYKILVGELERKKSLCIFQWQNNIKPYLKKIFLSLVLLEVCFSANDFAQNLRRD